MEKHNCLRNINLFHRIFRFRICRVQRHRQSDLVKCERLCAGEQLKAHLLLPNTWLTLVELRIPVSQRIQDHQESASLWHHSGKPSDVDMNRNFLFSIIIFH